MGQAITDPISGPSFDFTFTIGPELDNNQFGVIPLRFYDEAVDLL